MFKNILLTGNRLPRIRNALQLVIPLFIKYRLRILVGFMALLTVDLLQLMIPRVIKSAIDSLQFATASPASLLQHGMLVVGFALAIACCRFGWRYLILGFSRMLERDLRNRMLAKLVRLDRPFFNRRSTGEIMALSSNDLAAVQMACGIGLVSCVDAIMMTTAALFFMAYIHPQLTMIALAPMPILALLTGLLTKLLHRRFSRVQEQFSRMTEFARSTLSAIRLIKAYTQEGPQTGYFAKMGREYVKNNLRLAVVQGALFPFSTLIANASLLLVIYFGGRLTIAGTISIGDFVAFMTYLFLMTWPMMAIGWVTTLFQRGLTSLDRINQVLMEEPVVQEPLAPLPMPLTNRRISVRNLIFSHVAQQHEPILDGINLEIPPGFLGIVGKTGSGKTTLCQLLARIYPVAGNQLFWEDIDVNRLSLAEVRARIAYVPQDTLLFSDTIGANIGFGNPDADQAEIEQAASLAAIHDEIIGFEKGYQARVGERGLLLSGGQRQRITLARALLMDRPVIIIDDGLSAVDTDTEHRIISNFKEWLPGRTCIMASHRVAPIMAADQIVVMEGGRITDRGSHHDLLDSNRFYKTIYNHQMSTGGAGN
ncbi:MAG: ABC transporter ATP-binding protein [Desulfobulbaceae bacterium]|nr:ABC transporter ATP-binding protein [Desulfobulbaceae bacterium]